MQRVSVKERRAAAECKAGVALDVDLAKHEVAGSVPVEYFSLRARGYDRIRVRDAQLDLVASDPTNWATDAGAPRAQVDMAAERVAVGKRHFRAPRSSVKVRRMGVDQYAFGARLAADRVSWGSFPRDAKSSFELKALVDAQKPALDADASLAIAGGAATKASLQASQNASITRYNIAIGGEEAGPLLGALLFEDGGRSSDELSFAFESSGAFRGLFSKDDSGALVPSRAPLRTARGTHRSGLRVERLSLLRAGLTHQIRGLNVEARSTHESPGRGSLDANASMKEALYGDSERPMSLHDYAQSLDVAYAAIHGAPSFSVKTDGTLEHLDQPYVRQYPIREVSFGAEVDVDDTEVFAVRHAYMRNAAGGTKFEAKGSYEGWRDAIRATEVCTKGLKGCPEVASMYGREAATVTGTFEQDFSFWRSTERTKSGGSIVVPFTVESGDLNTYRVRATTEIRDVVLELPEHGLLIEDLDALIPVDQEFATAPELFMVPATADNAIAQKRFFDLYPFTERDSFLTLDRMQLGQEVVGPVAANVHVAGSTIAVDQIHAAYRNGFVTGQFRADLNQDDPKILFRGHLTGVRVNDGDDVLDANLAITFVPTTLIVEGKVQIVRVSKEHLYEIIDVLDPYHEDEDLNRVRLGLKFGYPKFVLIKLDEGLMNAKIDLGGLAGAVRIDEIKGIPVTPFLEQYIQPYIERILSPSLFYEAVPAESDDPPKVSQALEGQ
jgi:translocation and assembly module TamB